jgi:hypothetical protein
MDQWMPAFVQRTEAAGCTTLTDFAERLRAELETNMSGQPPSRMIVQIAGYARDSAGVHPEVHVVRNYGAINADGTYPAADNTFWRSEEFYSAVQASHGSPTGFEGDEVPAYFNGFPSGRIAYLAAMQQVGSFLQQIWSTPPLQFRAPGTLDELAGYVRLHMTVIRELFVMSGQTVVGGPIQLLQISPPTVV